MKKILISLFTLCSINAFASVGDSGPGTNYPEYNYCLQSGGDIVDMQAVYDTHDGLVKGESKKFCRLSDSGTLVYIGLSTLATTPTLAATYAQRITIDINKKLPAQPYSNPALNVCSKLHGSEIVFNVFGGGFSDKYGEADICVFGDGSAISAWSMIYGAFDPQFILHKVIRSKPLNIDIPAIQ